MDSPDAHCKATAASPPIKDSPFSAYISSLSPIPAVQTRPGISSYGDINFPSPEPVFRSPHIRQKKVDVLRSSEKNCTRNNKDDTTCSRDVQMDGTLISSSAFKPTLSIENQCEGSRSPGNQPCCSSPCVDVFLSDPSENRLNDSGSPNICSMRKEEASQVIDGRSTRITANQTNCEHNEFPNSPTIAPPPSSAMNEFLADSLRNFDLPSVQLRQDTTTPQALLDDCAYIEGNVDKIHCSKIHKHICDSAIDRLISSSKAESHQSEESTIAEDVENMLKAGNQLEEMYEMHHNEQLNTMPADTNIRRTLPSATQNEKNLMDQKTNVTSFRSMDLENEMWKSSCLYMHYHDGMHTDNSGNQESDESGLNSKFIQESPLDDHAAEKFIIPAERQTPYDEEDSQHQCAMRKRLQFETAENNEKSPASGKQITGFKSLSGAEPAEILMYTNTLDTSIVEPTETFSSKQSVQSATNVSCEKKGGSHVTVHRPFAIGLHLNTLGSIGQAIRTDMQLIEKDVSEGETSLSEVNDQAVQTVKDQLPSTGLISHDSISLSASKDKESLNNAGNFQCSLPTEPVDRYLTPCNMKRLHAGNTISVMPTQSSPRKKRKKGKNAEGQKRCSCRRSKCLKLYCDCFAAGAVCTEACGCCECLNIPEHEDTILETRKQIESRNPLAFAPKVILHVSNPSEDNEEILGSTPSSARHKRGCNCKKSHCHKKYCECFQAGVGCSIGCRCEGCKNTFGRKDGSSECIEIRHQKLKEDNCNTESPVTNFDGTMKMDAVKAERHLHLSPLTPSIQCSNICSGNGTDIHKPLLNLSYLTSPESSASLLPCHVVSPSSPIRSIGDITFENDTEEANSLVPHSQSWDYDTAVKAEAILSPGWDGFQDIFNLSPLTCLSPGTTDSSVASTATNTKVPQSKLSQGHSRAKVGPLQWRYSPVTPLPQLGESKVLLEPDMGSGLHKDPEKGTPDVLNMTPLSIGAVQSKSPRQKRISPRKQTSQTKSISSPGLRNTRKFILKSVPSLPPFSPCSNEKDGAT